MKKVLFITYFWPPSGKASLHWPLEMIKYLPENGWEPSVLTVNEDTFYQKDETLLKEISPDLKIIKTGTIEPFNVYRKFLGKKKDEPLIASESMSQSKKSFNHMLSLWIRMNLFVPDARVGWYLPGVIEGKKFLSKNKIDAIISNGPPHTAHLLGRRLSSLFNIPHLPVFIDPWADIVYYQDYQRTKLTQAFDKYLEGNVIKKAKEIVFVTETMKNDYIKKYPQIKDKTNVLYWGYNEEDFGEIENEVNNSKPDEEIIAHAGNMYDYNNPVSFFEYIKTEINKGRKIKIKFIGTVSPKTNEIINNLSLSGNTEYIGFLPYKQMLIELLKSDVLLMMVNEKRHVPGKLFEYLRTGKPILAFGNDNQEVKIILENANAGMIFNYQENAKEFFDLTKNGYKKFKTDIPLIKKYARRNIAGELSKILDKAAE
ncbi:MAG: glycosyltransferase [Ignavibacteriaceae bacterium]